MSQHAKQLCSSLPADRVSSHRGHVITPPMQVTQLSSGWRTAGVWGGNPQRLLRVPVKRARFLVPRRPFRSG